LAGTSDTAVTPHLLARIEAMGVEGRERHWAALPEDLARRLRPRVRKFGGGIATLLERSDALRVNRVIGVGHRERVNASMLDEIVEFFMASRIRRFGFELGPGSQHDALARWLAERGFSRHAGYSLLVRDLSEPVTHRANGVRAVKAARSDLETSVELAERIFSVPASRRSWALAAARAGQVQHFLVYMGDQPAAVGALLVVEDLAWLGGGGTLTRFRHHGAHAALVATRLRHAARLGCRWAWSETIAPQPGRPQGSRRNLIRLGFHEACLKPNFVWGEPAGTSRAPKTSRVPR
jgi:hypothetical protein